MVDLKRSFKLSSFKAHLLRQLLHSLYSRGERAMRSGLFVHMATAKPPLGKIGNRLRQSLQIPARSIDGEVKHAAVAAGFAGQDLPGAGAVFIDPPDISKNLLFGKPVSLRLFFFVHEAACKPGADICADVDTERLKILKDDIRIAAYDDKVIAKRGNLSDDFSLADQEACPDTVVKPKVGKGIPVGELHVMPSMVGENMADMVRFHIMFLRQSFYDLFIIIIPSEAVRETFAKFTATAAELSADRNNSHTFLFLTKTMIKTVLPCKCSAGAQKIAGEGHFVPAISAGKTLDRHFPENSAVYS